MKRTILFLLFLTAAPAFAINYICVAGTDTPESWTQVLQIASGKAMFGDRACTQIGSSSYRCDTGCGESACSADILVFNPQNRTLSSVAMVYPRQGPPRKMLNGEYLFRCTVK